MWNIVLFLVPCCHSNLFFSHNHIMIVLCVDPTNSFKGERCSNLIYSTDVCRALEDFKVIVCALLFWLVNSFNNNSDTTFIVRIFCIVTVQESDSLFCHVLFLNPKLHKWRNLFDIHELNVINMPILLSLYDHTWRNAFVAHGFRIRFVILTRSIHLVPELWGRQAVITFHITWMNSLALQFLLFKIVVERDMGCIGNKFPI